LGSLMKERRMSRALVPFSPRAPGAPTASNALNVYRDVHRQSVNERQITLHADTRTHAHTHTNLVVGVGEENVGDAQ
jgi:hypothetical protein